MLLKTFKKMKKKLKKGVDKVKVIGYKHTHRREALEL